VLPPISEHSSLFCFAINEDRKKFFKIDTRIDEKANPGYHDEETGGQIVSDDVERHFSEK
jgi:hypothetical protein